MMHFTLNGQPRQVALAPDYPLLDALRQHLGLHSVRLGCGQEQCGTCHVLIDGQSVPTCSSSVDRIAGRRVEFEDPLDVSLLGARPYDPAARATTQEEVERVS